MKTIIQIACLFLLAGTWRPILAFHQPTEPALETGQQTTGYQPGDLVVNFALKDLNGKPISLKDFSGAKGLIIIFSNMHCPFSRSYENRMIALQHKFGSMGFPVLAINPSNPNVHQDDALGKIKERAISKGFNFTYGIDSDQKVTEAFGPTRIPTAFVLQRNGDHFEVKYRGLIDDNPQDAGAVTRPYVEEAVSNLLDHKPVITPTTLAEGCRLRF
ncbi:thioredoxin family protein [Dyadobacter jejuensis]|nr:thioredoxin family protein [Dyadobacter jejuensis]